MSNSISQTLRIFVDEAGSLAIKPTSESASRRVIIICAVAVSPLQEEKLLNLLPRDHNGNWLKSSDKLMCGQNALRFVRDLLDSPSDASLVLVDAGLDENYAVVNEVTEIVNRARSEAHKPHIRAPNLNYALLVKDAIIGVFGLAWKRAGYKVRSFDIVLDSGNLSRFDRKHFQQIMIENGAKHELHLQVTWCCNEDQPLLNAPDIIAGIMHRRLIYEQLKEPADLLLQAARNGRIAFQNGRTFVPLPPS
jgi:hypothetical protein